MSERLAIDAAGVGLTAELVPWDAEVLGFPVASLSRFRVEEQADVRAAFQALDEWLDANAVGLVSCRLPAAGLRESFALEAAGFRFIETVLHPVFRDLQKRPPGAPELTVSGVRPPEVEALAQLAESCFGFERFHADPRLDDRAADRRYGNWVRNAAGSARQELLKIEDDGQVVAFFIVEAPAPIEAYWHLTAVAPAFQGQGYGRRVWRAVMDMHREQGVDSVATTIAARNVPVLNLYASLDFRFLPPEMTFHLVR